MLDRRAIRGRVVAAARQILDHGLVGGTAGNVSARTKGGDTFWITPSGISFSALSESQLVEVDVSGRRRTGKLKPSSDATTHAAIYRRRPDVGAVVHTHSPYATVFAVLRRPIPPLLVDAAGFLGGGVPVMGKSIGKSRAALLPNHGVIAVGESIEAALTAAMMVEQSAKVALLARMIGKPRQVPRAEIERMHRFLHTEYGQTK